MRDIIHTQLKKQHWKFYWSGNAPLLDEDLVTNKAWRKQLQKIGGVFMNAVASVFQNGIITIYHTEEEYQRLDEFYLRKFKRNNKFLITSAEGYTKRTNKDLAELKKIYSIKNLSQLTNYQLINLIKKARSFFVYNSAMDHYDWYMERLFIPILEKYISSELSKKGQSDKIVDFINTLLTPHKISQIFIERKNFFSIVQYIRNNKAMVRKLISNKDALKTNPVLRKKIRIYLSKHSWANVFVNNPPSTENSIWDELYNFIKNNTPLKVQSKRLGDNYDRNVINKSRVYFHELNPNLEIRQLILGLRAMAFLRTEDYAVMSHSTYYVIPLYTEIANRLGITYKELKEFLPEHIISYLQSGEIVPKSELQKRLNLSVYILYNGNYYFYSGKEAIKYKNIFIASQKQKDSRTQFSGTPAHPGVITGTVKLGMHPSVLPSIKKGDIVVSSFMSSMFAHSLSKASGLVTEYSGLTSHPVIVAREFNIPCIVGVKDITKYLKDGDKVIVDANKGTITLLK